MKGLARMHIAHHTRVLSIFLITLLFIGGCVSVKPIPIAARSGDTIMLAVGSPDGMNPDNTTADFYPDPVGTPNTFIPVPVRETVKLYPDKTSRAWLNDSAGIPRRSSHGPWLTVLVADLPVTLPVGTTGILRVSTDSQQVDYPRFASTPDGTDIPLTILDGSGSQSDFGYRASDQTGAEDGDLKKLRSLFQVIVKPEVPAEGQAEAVTFGAIEMNLTIPVQDLSCNPFCDPLVHIQDEGIAVVLDDQPQNTWNQTQLIWKRTGDVFDIMLISPKGMYGHEARVSIVPRWPEYEYGVSGIPVLNSIVYYDLDGGLHPGPLPANPTIETIDNTFF